MVRCGRRGVARPPDGRARRRAAGLRPAGLDRRTGAGNARAFCGARHTVPGGSSVTSFDAPASRAGRNSGGLIVFSAIGLLMLLFVAAGPWIIRSHGYGIFIPAVASSGLLTIVAASLAGRIDERSGLMVALGLGLAMRLLLVNEEPFLSTDLYRYIWDGRVQA